MPWSWEEAAPQPRRGDDNVNIRPYYEPIPPGFEHRLTGPESLIPPPGLGHQGKINALESSLCVISRNFVSQRNDRDRQFIPGSNLPSYSQPTRFSRPAIRRPLQRRASADNINEMAARIPQTVIINDRGRVEINFSDSDNDDIDDVREAIEAAIRLQQRAFTAGQVRIRIWAKRRPTKSVGISSAWCAEILFPIRFVISATQRPTPYASNLAASRP